MYSAAGTPEATAASGVEKAVLAELCAGLRYSTLLCDVFFKCISNLKGACQLHAARQASLAPTLSRAEVVVMTSTAIASFKVPRIGSRTCTTNIIQPKIALLKARYGLSDYRCVAHYRKL